MEIVSIALLVGALWLVSRRRRQRAQDRWQEVEGMPAELQAGVLVLSEAFISCVRPIALNGKTDQVYRVRGGQLVVVENKRHDWVGLDDVLQASLYAFILRHRTPHGRAIVPVAPYGYIRTVGQSGPHYHRVRLVGDEKLMSIYHAYVTSLAARRDAEPRRSRQNCRLCVHKVRCEGGMGSVVPRKHEQIH